MPFEKNSSQKPSFIRRLKNTMTSMRGVAKAPVRCEFPPGETALLVIDVQEKYCDPNGRRGTAETEKICEKIAQLSAEFRKVNIPVYAIYFGRNDLPVDEIDFFKFKPAANDIIVRKECDSAFVGSNIKELLKENKHKHLLACGFNLNACVQDTVIDAEDNGFAVTILSDITGNDQLNNENPISSIQRMKNAGANFLQTGQVLSALRTTQ